MSLFFPFIPFYSLFCPFFPLLPLLQEIADKEEVDGYADGEDGEHSNGLRQAEAEEEGKQECLQEEVDEVGQREASSTTGGGTNVEGVASGGYVIEEKADDIGEAIGQDREAYPCPLAKGKGGIVGEKRDEKQVDAVLNGDCQHADDAEANDFAKPLLTEMVYNVLHLHKLTVLYRHGCRHRQ